MTEKPNAVHVALGGEKIKMPYADFATAIEQKKVTPDTLCWVKGLATWQKAEELFPELFDASPEIPAAQALPKQTNKNPSSYYKDTTGKHPLAPIYLRVLAALVDAVILLIPMTIAGLVTAGFGEILVLVVYPALLLSSELQATVGMKVMGLRIVDVNGERITIQKSFLRSGAALLSAGVFCLGFLCAFFAPQKQTLHDVFAETFVVKA